MLRNRYLIALTIACTILMVGVAVCYLAHRAVVNHVLNELRKPEHGVLVTPETEALLQRGILPPDFGTELPPYLTGWIVLADLFVKFSVV